MLLRRTGDPGARLQINTLFQSGCVCRVISIFRGMGIDTIASVILEKLRGIAQTDTVIGQPIVVDRTTLIPVSKVSIGFGLGSNTGKSELTGSGGGLSVEPIAFIVINDGNAKILSLTRDKDVFGKAVELVPEVIAMLKKGK